VFFFFFLEISFYSCSYIETDNVDLSTVQTSVQIQNSIISHNYARGLTAGSAGGGGGIYINRQSSSDFYDAEMVITIKQSTFTSNSASSSGGAIKVVTNNNPKKISVVIFECDMYNNFIYTKTGDFLVNDVAADDMKSQIFLLNTDVNSIGGVTCGSGTCGNKKCSQSVQLECKKLGYDGCTTIGEHDTIRSTPFCHPIRICTPSKANRTANKYYWYGEMNVNQTNGCTMLRTVYLNSDFTINGDKQFLPLLRAPIIQLGNFSTYDNRSTDIKIFEPTNEELEDLSEYSRRYFSVSQHSKVTINYVTLSGGRTCIKRRSGLDSLKSTCGGGSLRIINYGDRPSHVILNGVHMKGCLGHQKFACSEFGGGIFISGKGSVLEINANSSFENNRARVHGGAIYAQNIAYCEFGNNDCTPKFTITGGVSFKDNIAIGDPYIISPIISPGESKEAKEKVFKVFKEYGIGRGGAIALSNNIEDLITTPDQTEAEEAASGTIVIESGPSNSIVFSNNVAIGNSMYGMSGMDITTFEVPVSHSIYAKLASIQFTTCPRGTYAFNPDTNPKSISSPQKLGYNFVGCPNVCSKMWTTSGNTKTDYLEASSSSPCSKTCPAGYFCPGDFSASSSPGIALCPPSRFGDTSGLDKPTCSGECDPPASCGEPGGALKMDGTKYCNVVGKWEVIIADSCMLSTTYIVQGEERKRIQGDSLHIRTLWGPPSPRTLTNEEPKRHFKVEQGGTLQVSRLKLKGGVIYNVRHKREENYHSGSILYNEGTVELFNVEFIKNDVKKDEPSAYTGGCVYSGTKSILTVEESTFSNCYAGLFGGAIHFNGDILNVTSSDFVNNFANTSGGAIYLEQMSKNKKFAVNFKTDTTSGRTNKFTDNGAENQDQANAIGWSRLPGSTINFDLCPASTFGLSGDSFAPYDDGVINTQCKVQSLDSRISYKVIKCFPKANKPDVGFVKNFYGCPNVCPVRKTTAPLFLSAKRQASPNKRHQFCDKTCPVNYFCDGENHGPIACPTGKYGDKLGLQTQDECKTDDDVSILYCCLFLLVSVVDCF
jgi:predicted outer membrane repeat protein